MAEEQKYEVDDLAPTSDLIESVYFRELEVSPLKDKSYQLITSEDTLEGKTDDSGMASQHDISRKGLQVKLDVGLEDSKDDEGHPDNSGPLNPLDLRNSNEGGNGPVARNTPRSNALVTHVQQMLAALGFNLGTTGPEGDGIDGKFGNLTEKAVKEFQESRMDYDDSPLKVDGKVGPKTSDALNRAIVGIWYPKYQTPRDLTPTRIVITAVSTELNEGVAIEEEESEESEEGGASKEDGGEEGGESGEDEAGEGQEEGDEAPEAEEDAASSEEEESSG